MHNVAAERARAHVVAVEPCELAGVGRGVQRGPVARHPGQRLGESQSGPQPQRNNARCRGDATFSGF